MNIRIMPIRSEDVDTLCGRIPIDDGLDHGPYLDQQTRDVGVYLIAWDRDVFVRLAGNTEVPRIVDTYPEVAQFADCPELCDVRVVAERRSEGIGTQLLQRGIRLAHERGIAQITVCVNTDNPRARSLYQRLGFAEVGIGTFTTSGVFVDDAGVEQPWQNGPQVLLARVTEP